MQSTPDLALTVSYWLHMLGTVLWIGGLSTLVLLVAPAARHSMTPSNSIAFFQKIRSRLQGIGWFSLAILVATGMIQMSANPNYGGFLAISNRWSVAILAKHLIFGLMILVSAYLTWGLGPAVQRAGFRQAKCGEASVELEKLQRRESVLTWVNLGLAVIVLGLTALARVS